MKLTEVAVRALESRIIRDSSVMSATLSGLSRATWGGGDPDAGATPRLR